MSNSTSQVDFYISQQNDEAARLHILLRLLSKALQQQQQMLIVVDDDNQLAILSEQLWESVSSSFFVHEKLDEIDKAHPAPILLAKRQQIDTGTDNTAINLAFDLSTEQAILNYPRIIVIGNQNPNHLQQCREKYKFYQSHGITPKTIKV